MMGLVAILISLFLGYLLLRCFKPKDAGIDSRDMFLVFGLGAGFSSQIVFYSLLILGHISPTAIIAAHLFVLLGLFYYLSRRGFKPSMPVSLPLEQGLMVLGVLVLTAFLAVMVGMTKPWGDWDGWSYWNFHASFLFRAGDEWRRVFEFNVQAHHPWMLPLLIVWGWCFQLSTTHMVPFTIGVLFTVATVGLLILSLKKYVPFYWSLLAGVFLVSAPYFIQHGTSQYADIEAAFFILLSCVLSMDLFKQPNIRTAVLLGLCLGLTASAKDNSTVAAVILIVLLIIRLSKSNLLSLIRPLIWGFVATGLAVVIMRFFEVFHSLNDSYAASWTGMLDGHRWMVLGHFVVKTVMALRWGGIWPIVIMGLILKTQGTLRELSLIIQFMFFYIILYFLIFTVSQFDLEWLLGGASALDRTLFLLAPTAVFALFYIITHIE